MSKIVSDSLQSRSGNSIIVNNGMNVAGIVSATSFVGSGSSLTGITGKAAAMAIVFGG
jgi:hypothetical protein